MTIKTTLYITNERLKKLDRAAVNSGMKRSLIISALLRHLAGKDRPEHAAFSPVCYQGRLEEHRWTRAHVSLRCDEYEFSLDLRKVLKMSVSFIVAFAIDHYLEELLSLMKGDIDNYRYRDYVIMNTFVDNVMCWIIYWGLPQKLPMPPPPCN